MFTGSSQANNHTCFLLAEGFAHTRDRKKYFLPLLIASPWVLLCAPLLLLYSGARGHRGGKYFFYLFYLAHFLVLLALAKGVAAALT